MQQIGTKQIQEKKRQEKKSDSFLLMNQLTFEHIRSTKKAPSQKLRSVILYVSLRY